MGNKNSALSSADKEKLEKLLNLTRNIPEEEHVFGLKNYGNTCFCNAILQCLYFNPYFRKHVARLYPQFLFFQSQLPQMREFYRLCEGINFNLNNSFGNHNSFSPISLEITESDETFEDHEQKLEQNDLFFAAATKNVQEQQKILHIQTNSNSSSKTNTPSPTITLSTPKTSPNDQVQEQLRDFLKVQEVQRNARKETNQKQHNKLNKKTQEVNYSTVDYNDSNNNNTNYNNNRANEKKDTMKVQSQRGKIQIIEGNNPKIAPIDSKTLNDLSKLPSDPVSALHGPPECESPADKLQKPKNLTKQRHSITGTINFFLQKTLFGSNETKKLQVPNSAVNLRSSDGDPSIHFPKTHRKSKSNLQQTEEFPVSESLQLQLQLQHALPLEDESEKIKGSLMNLLSPDSSEENYNKKNNTVIDEYNKKYSVSTNSMGLSKDIDAAMLKNEKIVIHLPEIEDFNSIESPIFKDLSLLKLLDFTNIQSESEKQELKDYIETIESFVENSLLFQLSKLFYEIQTNSEKKPFFEPKSFIDELRRRKNKKKPANSEEFNNFSSDFQNPYAEENVQQDAHEFFQFLINNCEESLTNFIKFKSKIIQKLKNKNKNKKISLKSKSLSSPIPTNSPKIHPKPSKSSIRNSPPDSGNTSPPPESCEISPEASESSHFISRCFGGIITSKIRCIICEHISFSDETFVDISVGIKKNNTSLYHCLSKTISSTELLNGANKYYCSRCHTKQEAQKSSFIKILPANCLVIQLKRFKYLEEQDVVAKLNYRVLFPLKWKILQRNVSRENPKNFLSYLKELSITEEEETEMMKKYCQKNMILRKNEQKMKKNKNLVGNYKEKKDDLQECVEMFEEFLSDSDEFIVNSSEKEKEKLENEDENENFNENDGSSDEDVENEDYNEKSKKEIDHNQAFLCSNSNLKDDEESEYQEIEFELKSIVVHVGSTLHNGHYKTIAKLEKNDVWVLLDDDKVYQITETDVKNTYGYPHNNMTEVEGIGAGKENLSTFYTLFYVPTKK